MGLGFGKLLERVIRMGVGAAELVYEITDRPFRLPPALEGDTLVTDGPDDLWPDIDNGCCQVTNNTNLHVAEQWGLKLPNGQIHWNEWQGTPFGNPVDRMRMVAALQKTAEDIGLPSGPETDQFLSKYQWVTRLARATVEYEDTGAYSLTDPHVSALGAPEVDEPPHGNDPEIHPYAAIATNGQDSDMGFRPGPVGGDA